MHVLDVELIVLRPDYREGDVLAVLDAGHRLGARFALVLGYDSDRNSAGRQVHPGLRGGRGPRYPARPRVHEVQRGTDDRSSGPGRPAIRPPCGAVLVDALHLQRSGGSPASLAAVPPELLPYGQLCDGPLLPVWPDDDDARVESRTDRLLPGEGEFPLRELIHSLPAGSALSVEAPVGASRELPAAERAAQAFAAASSLLGTHRTMEGSGGRG